MAKFELDDKNRKILMILQQDSRASLTTISKKIGLSVDAVHKRIKKMNEHTVLCNKVTLSPQKLGYPLITDNKIKLKNISKKEANLLISYLVSHPRVIDLIQILGDWDLTCVIIAKDANDLYEVTHEIRYKFYKFIADWQSLMILKHFKFEEYDVMKL